MEYKYKDGKIRIEEILSNNNEIEKPKQIPGENDFTFGNGYYSWVTALFVDIKDSTKLFSNPEKIGTAKTIRAFTSEVIEILRDDNNLREIGIRGDCVYAIYSSPNSKTDYEIFKKAVYINTLIKMLNNLFLKNGLEKIEVGIGISTAKELVVKAGRNGVGINNLVWIGKAVTYASHFSSMGNRYIDKLGVIKEKYQTIIMSESFYKCIKKYYDGDGDALFQEHETDEYGKIYSCNMFMKEMNDWINGGMKN